MMFGPLGRVGAAQLQLPAVEAVLMQSGSLCVLLLTWMLLRGSAVPSIVVGPPRSAPDRGDDSAGL
ncbi:hypothetical protein GCM10009563_18990 [Subtercola frigoramans]